MLERKRNVFSLDLNVPSESLSVTVLGREFQVAGAEQRKARLAKAVLANGSNQIKSINQSIMQLVTRQASLKKRIAGVRTVHD